MTMTDAQYAEVQAKILLFAQAVDELPLDAFIEHGATDAIHKLAMALRVFQTVVRILEGDERLADLAECRWFDPTERWSGSIRG